VKDGLIVGVGRRGNPDTMECITPGLVIARHEVISGEVKPDPERRGRHRSAPSIFISPRSRLSR